MGGERQREGRRNCKDVDERKATTQPEVIYYTSNTHTPPPPLLLPLSLHSALTTPRVVLSKLLFCFLASPPLTFHSFPLALLDPCDLLCFGAVCCSAA